MTKFFAFFLALLLFLPIIASSQQAPADPAMAACRELLNESSGRVIDLAARLTKAQTELKTAQDELAALKKTHETPTPGKK